MGVHPRRIGDVRQRLNVDINEWKEPINTNYNKNMSAVESLVEPLAKDHQSEKPCITV